MWDSLTVRRESWARGSSVQVADDVRVFVGVASIADRLIGKVECNPSRLDDPAGCSLLPLDGLGWAVQVMAEYAAQLVEPGGPLDAWRVKRIDLARDFRGVRDPARYVHGLRPVHRPYARRVGVWSDPSSGNAQTLHAGSGAGMVRLYDQHEAYAHRGAPAGALRWEVEARSDWLGRIADVRTVADLQPSTLDGLMVDRWEWSAMGHEVASAVGLVERVGQLGLSPAREQRLIGQLVQECYGVAPRLASKQASEYRKLKRQLGLVPSVDLLQVAGHERSRLDWWSGQEVLVSA